MKTVMSLEQCPNELIMEIFIFNYTVFVQRSVSSTLSSNIVYLKLKPCQLNHLYALLANLPKLKYLIIEIRQNSVPFLTENRFLTVIYFELHTLGSIEYDVWSNLMLSFPNLNRLTFFSQGDKLINGQQLQLTLSKLSCLTQLRCSLAAWGYKEEDADKVFETFKNDYWLKQSKKWKIKWSYSDTYARVYTVKEEGK
ncbi:unnamed protein product [Didymodactylos carnosus]|uniref:Uncharacterized protein n=1 Tax=Didymodactylos carnosus TaxID=1234261 RepID=A0A8S2GUW3_9BILA|nr:unnamed protein product [Didymodactylos carnosus]CAF3563966.1 unnamed protein product [Didymodactylos carnosus]